MRKNTRLLFIYMGCLCFLIAACSKTAVESSESGAAGLASTPVGEASFYVPVEPPSAE